MLPNHHDLNPLHEIDVTENNINGRFQNGSWNTFIGLRNDKTIPFLCINSENVDRVICNVISPNF